MVMKDAGRLTIAGLAIGVPMTLAATRLASMVSREIP